MSETMPWYIAAFIPIAWVVWLLIAPFVLVGVIARGFNGFCNNKYDHSSLAVDGS